MGPSWHPTENLSLSWNLHCIRIRQKVTAMMSPMWDPPAPAPILWGPRSFSRRWWHAHAESRSRSRKPWISGVPALNRPPHHTPPLSPTPFLLSTLFPESSPRWKQPNNHIYSIYYLFKTILSKSGNQMGSPFYCFRHVSKSKWLSISQRPSQRREALLVLDLS